MGMSMTVRLKPALLPNEAVLKRIDNVLYVTVKSLPSYRAGFYIPLLLRESLILTDRRMLFVSRMFGLVVQEYSAWYRGCAPAGDEEFIASADTGRNRWLGQFLEVVSHNDNRQGWMSRFLSPDIRIRFYMRNTQALCEVGRDRMEQSSHRTG